MVKDKSNNKLIAVGAGFRLIFAAYFFAIVLLVLSVHIFIQRGLSYYFFIFLFLGIFLLVPSLFVCFKLENPGQTVFFYYGLFVAALLYFRVMFADKVPLMVIVFGGLILVIVVLTLVSTYYTKRKKMYEKIEKDVREALDRDKTHPPSIIYRIFGIRNKKK